MHVHNKARIPDNPGKQLYPNTFKGNPNLSSNYSPLHVAAWKRPRRSSLLPPVGCCAYSALLAVPLLITSVNIVSRETAGRTGHWLSRRKTIRESNAREFHALSSLFMY